MSVRMRDYLLAAFFLVGAVALGHMARQTRMVMDIEHQMLSRLSRAVDESDFGRETIVIGLERDSWFGENPAEPLARDYLAAVLDAIDKNSKPRAIGIDVLLDLPLEEERANEDTALAKSLQQARTPIVLAIESEVGHIAPKFKGNPSVGHIKVEKASNGAVGSVAHPVEKSFSEKLRQVGGFQERNSLPQILFPKSQTIAAIPANEILGYQATGHAEEIAHLLNGKIVLLGSMAREKGDYHPAPTKAYGEPEIAGVLVQAHAVASGLGGSPTYLVWLNVLLSALAAGIAIGLTYSFSGWKLSVGIACSLIFFGAASIAFALGNLIVNPVPALIAGSVGSAAWTHIRRQRLEAGYRSLVGERVHRSLREVAQLERLAPSEQVVAILFADLVGFGKFSKDRKPNEVLQAVNCTLGPFADMVVAHGGVVDRFTGDGILAIFGAEFPGREALPPKMSALNAVRCGLQMIRHVGAVSELEVGIGIHIGPVSSGLMGGKSFRQFVVMGETVNDAARIEAISHRPEVQPLTHRLLVSESVARLIEPEFQLQRKEYSPLKEFNDPIFEIKEGESP